MARSLLLLAAVVGLLSAAMQFQIFRLEHRVDNLSNSINATRAEIGNMGND